MNINSKATILGKSQLIATVIILVLVASIGPALSAVAASTLVTADFNSGTNGFVYADDAFGTSQPGYASGVRVASGGYGGTGGLQVTLGGVDATAITGLSGGWSYTLNLAAAETGVKLAFRYKLNQTATYEYDEYTRLLVKVDGVQYGRGAKNYVDHIGGDGASTQGNSSSYLPTTDWQQAEIYLGDLAAGSHTIVLGGYNNKKDAVDEATTATIDDVVVTSGNAAPVVSAAQSLADRVSISQFLAYNQGIAQFHDRCRGSGMSCSSTDYTTNYMNALAWVEGQLRGLGYTTFRHAFNYNGNTGTNICGTKQGTVTPTQMYIVSGHLDARSGGDGFDDDGSAVALGLEAARVLAGTDVTTDKSVRFCFWDKEEVGLYGARGYVQDRYSLQGTTAEPTWLGVIQHDMILYDHGAGTRTTAQSAYADLDVEWRAGTTKEADSRALALKWAYAVGQYAPDYPATAYNYSTNTDDTAFHSSVASISVRENRRSLSGEWINPYYHTTSDIESSYTRDDDADGKRDDIELGYNAVRTTLGLVAELAGAHVATANTAPVANAQTVTTNEDTAKTITLTGSDSDGDPLTYSVVTQPGHGTLSGTAPTLIYTPAANYNGADSFTFKVTDGIIDSAAATVSITVTPVNDAPVANAQSVTTNEDTAKTITLSGSDVDGNPLTYSVVTQPGHGALSGTAPNLTYTPAVNYNGADSFTFKVNDGTADSASATVSITVTPVNDAPVANAQAVTTNEDAAAAITLAGSDVEGSPLTYSVVTQPAHGTLSGTAPNLTYTPAANYNGADNFTFVVNDGTVNSTAATVSITVTLVPDAPVANSQSVTTAEDAPIAIILTGLDPDGDPLTYSVVSAPSHGALSGAVPNLTYTPVANYNGPDSFTFVANDGTSNSAPATVSITVSPVNDAPAADAQSVGTAEDTAVAVTLTGSDIDGDALAFSVTAGPAHGALSGAAPNLVYTPDANYNGPDSFAFKVNDGTVDSASATVSIAVSAVNDAPVAADGSAVTAQDSPVAITLIGSDVDGDPLTFSVTAGPSHGTLSGGASDLIYTPDLGYNGPDSFAFVVNDGSANSAEAAVSITVTESNVPPVADAQAVATQEDTLLAITLTGSDGDGDPLTYRIVSGPSHGTLNGVAPDLTYTPDADHNGSDSFSFVANDGMVDSSPAAISIDVTPVNDAPAANSQTAATAEDSALVLALTGSDVDGDPLTYRVVDSPAHGTLDGAAPDLTYTPAANYNGPDSFTFVVNDGAADSTPAAVSVTVSPVNDSPAAADQAVAANEDTAVVVTLSGADPDGDPLTYRLVSGPSHGPLSGLAPDLTYTPAANYSGSDSFTFVVNDGTVDSGTATVTVAVAAVNDAPVADGQSVTTQQNTAVSVTLTGSDVDGDALTFMVTASPSHGTLSGTAPILTYTPTAGYSGADSFAFVANDGAGNSVAATVNITVTPVGPWLYLGSSSSGTAGGISFADEDILIKNMATGAWAMFFDGSDVGLSSADVDAFELMADASLLMSFGTDFTLTGFSAVDDSDILRFTPTSTGDTTAGTWSWYFDGSDVGLSGSAEDVDAFDLLADGRLLVSTADSVSVTGVSGADEDLLAFTPTALGATTSGTWAMYFDGSDVGLSSTSNEDVNGVWVDAAGKIYLTTLGAFSVTGVSGDGSDIFICTPGLLGSTTTCTFSMYWDGSVNGFSGEDTDSVSIVQ